MADVLKKSLGTFAAWWALASLTLRREEEQESSWADQYDYLKAYYLSNGLYDVLRQRFSHMGYSRELLKPLRNPSFRVVEYYASHLWPGTLPGAFPVSTTRKGTSLALFTDTLSQVWAWSNWASEKQSLARSFPMLGDMFLKVSTRTENNRVNRVYIQSLEPATVTDFDADERGYLTWIRLDVPVTERDNAGALKHYTHTEVWDKAEGTFRFWRHTGTPQTTLSMLGNANDARYLDDFGIDFIPIVWQPFRNIGDSRGMAAITAAIDKIDEANRQATQLHKMLFRHNKPLWVAKSSGFDSQGKPTPAPVLGDDKKKAKLERNEDPDVEDVIKLPGATDLQTLIPQIDYTSALAVLQDQMAEIRQDLPELVYSQLQERSDLSGVAIRYLMEAAINRLLEARGNGEAALARAHEIAFTIGVKTGLFPSALGTYEAGDFAHSFIPRPVLTLAEKERAEIMGAYVQAGVPTVMASRRVGWTDADRETMTKDQQEADTRANANLAAAMLNSTDNANAGNTGGSFLDDETIEEEDDV